MITVKVPTRIDLAGGTLDIWPLSTIFAPAVCINAAINLYATVEAKESPGTESVVIRTHKPERKTVYRSGIPDRSKSLYHRVLDFFPVKGWELSINNLSPAGAGLGGSSSLVIALIRAMCGISGKRMRKPDIIELSKNIEARHIGIPTGVQDYVAAIEGGINRIYADTGGISYERLPVKNYEIEKRIILAYSGRSRISAKANWLMFRKAIEGDKRTVRIFRGIAENSLRVEEALLNGRFDDAGVLIEKENRLRERLGPSVIPAFLKKVFDAVRKKGGRPKICGAGGGGCFIVWCDPEMKTSLKTLLEQKGMQPLDFKVGFPSLEIA